MSKLIDWMLAKLRLVDDDIELEEVAPGDNPWFEMVRGRKEKPLSLTGRVYYKNVQNYDDCKQIIDNYKMGAVCVYKIEVNVSRDAQELMNYICGGIYALEGDVNPVSGNVYVTSVGAIT